MPRPNNTDWAAWRAFVALASGLVAAVGVSPLRAEGVVAYQNIAIETMAKAGRIQRGVLVIRDGLVEAVGADIDPPDTARLIDASGQTVMPAIVDPYHPVNLGGGGAQPEFREVTFRGRTFRIPTGSVSSAGPFLKVSQNLDPLAIKDDIRRLARTGIAYVNLVTRGYGQSARIASASELDATIDAQDSLLYLPITNATTSLKVLRDGLKTGAGSSGASRSRSGGSSSPTTALWKDVVAGKSRVIVNVNNAASILHVLQVLKDHEKAKLVLVANGSHIFETMEALKKRKGIAVVLRPEIETEPNSAVRINAPRMLHEAKIPFALSFSLRNDLSALGDAPLFPIARLIRGGLERQAALRALTLTPAELLGVDKELGSLEKGKKANILFFDGDPLDPASHVRRVMVEGRIVHEG